MRTLIAHARRLSAGWLPAAALVLLAALAPPAARAGHPSLLPPLTADGPFPRATAEQLRENGFPDHQHAYWWPDWQPRRDAAGRAFGFGSLCRGRELLSRPDAAVGDSTIVMAGLELQFDPRYQPCDVASFLELCEAARRDLGDWLGLSRPDTLVIVDTDRTEQYKKVTRQGTWRMYKLQGDTCVVQPVPVLTARTLAGHAAYDLLARWLLDRPRLRRLPPWFRDGLAAYTAELGVHLNNYLFMYRNSGPVTLAPAQVDAVLAAPPAPDPARDQQLFRRARYSAFLMVWDLVENRGGLAPVRKLLAAVAGGEDPDAACRRAWGMDWRELAAALDPTQRDDPGTAMGIRRPHLRPAPAAAPQE